MRPKFLAQFVFLTLFLLSCACTEFNLTDQFTLRRIERQDHEFCISQGLDYENPDDLKNKIYWSCRLQLTNYRLIPEAVTEDQIRNNRIIKHLLRKISLKFLDASEANLERVNTELEEIDHKNCRSQGYNLNTLDQSKVEQYFICRKKLIDKRSQTLTETETRELEASTNRYNLGYIVDKRLEKKKEFMDIVGRDYPQCLEIEILDPLFAKCKLAQDKTRACMAQIPQQKIDKEVEAKTNCQRDVTKVWPDSFIKEEPIPENKLLPRKEEISDIRALIALRKDEKGAEKTVEKQKFENSPKGLYSTFELNLLKQKYLDSCYVEVDKSLIKFVADLEERCQKIADNWNVIY